MHRILTCLLAIFLPAAAAQQADAQAGAPGKQARAVRVDGNAIRVDGNLDEAVWASAPAITDFVQKEPVEGGTPSERMEVRFVYDDGALYVGARMFSRDPGGIQAPLGRRDAVGSEAEHIFVSLDTFLDRRTAYTFGVSASGVRFDQFHATDAENGDAGFDPVWQAKTRIDESGWTAELWIPLTQLRFNDQAEHVWGLNVQRFVPTREEASYWVMIPRTVRAWASRFGELRGIEGVRPSRRLELLPSVVAASTRNDERVSGNPFDDGRNLQSRMGLDIKMGVGPNLTLDATVNPDFGQVEADPAEVNLSAFATRFPERRPFFTEGSELLTLRHPNVFYSRRIGAPPVGRVTGDFVDYPANTPILGAAKLTGRLRSGTSVGMLSAVTDQAFARVYDEETGEISRLRVAPRAAYGVVRVLQEFGNEGSTASVLVGGVHRGLGGEDPLASLLARDALVFGTDALLRFRRGEYELRWALIGSHVTGEPPAIERIQRSSSHYMQRPDRTYGLLDPTRASLSGVSLIAGFDRTGGRHWLFGLNTKIDTPTFDTNDIAILNDADGIQPSFNLTYRETRPGTVFRSYSVRLNQNNEWSFGWERKGGSVGSTVNLTWLNFWTTTFAVSREFRSTSADLTRGGPRMGQPRAWRVSASGGNSPAAQTRFSAGVVATGDELGGVSRQVNANFSFRPGPRWQLSMRPSYVKQTDSQQYVATLPGGRSETFGSRYVFAYIDRTTVATEFRMAFTLKPDLNLDVYAEPFAASGRYFDYGELLAPASMDRIRYGADGTRLDVQEDGSRVVTEGSSTFRLPNRDFNVRSFNSNVVLRWEWRAGSTMYLVWQQNRDARETIGTPVGVGDVFRSVTEPGSNILMFKTSWWLPAT